VLDDAKVNILAFLTTTSGTGGPVHPVVETRTSGRRPWRARRFRTPRRMSCMWNSPICLEPCRKASCEGDQHHVRLRDSGESREEGKRGARAVSNCHRGKPLVRPVRLEKV
jgi:hypothetical protein